MRAATEIAAPAVQLALEFDQTLQDLNLILAAFVVTSMWGLCSIQYCSTCKEHTEEHEQRTTINKMPPGRIENNQEGSAPQDSAPPEPPGLSGSRRAPAAP